MKDAFSALHPAVSFTYFAAVIVFGMFFMHPVFLALSFVSAMTYSIYLNGRKAVRFNLLWMFPSLLLVALVNPLFNHEGLTVLTYYNNNPITLESILYGVAAGVMFVTVIIWFSCYNVVMTSDKFLHLFGRLVPAFSLIFCMVLRLVPKFKAQIRVISQAQRGVGRDAGSGNLLTRAKNGIKILSILTTWALENAVETADSMRSRGYGIKGRTHYSNFRFDRRDGWVLSGLCALIVLICIGAAMGENTVAFFPSIVVKPPSAFSVLVYIAYFAFLMLPVLLDLLEDFKWNRMKSRV